MALGILDSLQQSGKITSLLQMEHNSAQYLHVLIEALRYIFRKPIESYHLYSLSDWLLLVCSTLPLLEEILNERCRYPVLCD
jgi:hypothetical protein